MDDDAVELLVDARAPGGDAQDREPRRAQHVEPPGAGLDADAGLVEVLDRGPGADDPGDPVEEAVEAPAVRRPMAVMVAVVSGTAKRSRMSSATRCSGTNWACSR